MIIPNTMDTITNLRARIDCACASTTSPLAAADLACVKKNIMYLNLGYDFVFFVLKQAMLLNI